MVLLERCFITRPPFEWSQEWSSYTGLTLYSQIVYHNPCFNLFILHNNSFDNQGSEINKNDIFLRFDILSFTKNFLLILAEHFNMGLKESSFSAFYKVSSVVTVFKNVGKRFTTEKYLLVLFRCLLES